MCQTRKRECVENEDKDVLRELEMIYNSGNEFVDYEGKL